MNIHWAVALICANIWFASSAPPSGVQIIVGLAWIAFSFVILITDAKE